MLVTPAEASGRWCPFGRQPGQVGNMFIPINRMPNGDVPSCLGPLCMSWRWHDPKIPREIDLVSEEVVDEVPRRGYCGAFGKPEHGD